MRRMISANTSVSRRGPSGPFTGLTHALHAALGIGEGSFLFRIAATRQNNVGILRGFGHEQFFDNQEIKRPEGMNHVMRIGVGANGVFAEEEQGLDTSINHRGEALRCHKSRRAIHFHAPRRLELRKLHRD